MSERERDRRLHVENRLEELRAKYGRDIEHEPLPDWLDHMPEAAAPPAPKPAPPPAARQEQIYVDVDKLA